MENTRKEVEMNNMESVLETMKASFTKEQILAMLGFSVKKGLSDEEKAERKARKEQKEQKKAMAILKFDSEHIYIVKKAINKKGQTYNRKVILTGYFNAKGLVFTNLDANAYVVAVDNLNNGIFISSETRVSKSSRTYECKKERVELTEDLNRDDIIQAVTNLTVAKLIEKASTIKDFKELPSNKMKRANEVLNIAVAKATKANNARLKAIERTKENA